MLKDQKVTSFYARKRRSVTARLESYHRGYLTGFRSGTQKGKASKKAKTPARKATKSKASKKVTIALKLDAYNKGYHLGVREGAQQMRAQHTEAMAKALKIQKAKRQKLSKDRSKRLAAARDEAYQTGLKCGVRRERAKQARVRKGESTANSSTCVDQGSTPKANVDKATKTKVLSKFANVAANSGSSMATKLTLDQFTDVSICGSHAAAPKAQSAASSKASPLDICAAPTPSRPSLRTAAGSRTTAASHPLQKVSVASKRTALQLPRQEDATMLAQKRPKVPPRSAEGASPNLATRTAEPPRVVTQNLFKDRLAAFLENPRDVTTESAAFQLRCKQMCQIGCKETGILNVPKKVVIIVDGKCRLWKLNQIIAECFNASQHKFAHDPKKGVTVLGSHFTVSRPFQPAQCNKVVISSSSSASHMDIGSAFIDDRRCSVAQLFRGKSTRFALQRELSEAAQRVVFASPLLNADVSVSLDGIMLDSYDNRNPFDKKRRHSNGHRPLPRIVRSSFLGNVVIDAKNYVMQGYAGGSEVHFDASYPAIHGYYRVAQRKPLFRKDGRDFDLNDPHKAAKDDESDSDAEEISANVR